MVNKDKLTALFDDFNSLNVLVVGDVMIDAYYVGKVDRVSPEAPVPIVAVEKRENRLGGAANVALNVQALGANPILCTVIGADEEAEIFEKLVQKRNLSTAGILKDKERITTVKTRIIGNKHQVLRVDSETDEDLTEKEVQQLVERIAHLTDTEKIDVVIFEDYDKGIITETLIKKVTTLCGEKSIPIAADPKKRNFKHYKGISLFKPNLKELKEGLDLELDLYNLEKIRTAIDQLKNLLSNEMTFITLSENGVFMHTDTDSVHVPAYLRNIADVSGAGDTVISVAALCLALKQPAKVIAELSNLAGGLVCEKVGVVPINKDQLLAEAMDKLT